MGKSHEGTDLQKLAQEFINGDESALTEIVHVLGPTFARQLAKHFGPLLNCDDIDDVLAQTVYRIWQHRKDYQQDRGSFQNWCYLIARNTALDALRQKARERKHFQRLQRELSESQNEWQADVREEDIAKLRKALSMLSPEDRRILRASVGKNEATWAVKLAKSMNIEPGNVRQRRFRALKRLRKEWARLGDILG